VAKTQEEQEIKAIKTKECLEKHLEDERSKTKLNAAKDFVVQSRQ
jgi:predicted RNase H-like nuclease (RuvC/YqgF family)